jgi:hypothetical protein
MKEKGSYPSDSPNPSSRTRTWFTQPLAETSTRNKKKCFWGVKHGRCVRLINPPPSVSRLSRQWDPRHLWTPDGGQMRVSETQNLSSLDSMKTALEPCISLMPIILLAGRGEEQEGIRGTYTCTIQHTARCERAGVLFAQTVTSQHWHHS